MLEILWLTIYFINIFFKNNRQSQDQMSDCVTQTFKQNEQRCTLKILITFLIFKIFEQFKMHMKADTICNIIT